MAGNMRDSGKMGSNTGKATFIRLLGRKRKGFGKTGREPSGSKTTSQESNLAEEEGSGVEDQVIRSAFNEEFR